MVWTAEPSAAEISAVLVGCAPTVSGSGDVDEGIAEIVLHCLLRNPEGASDAHCGKFPVMHQAIHRHLGDTHECSNLGNSEETDLAQ